MLLRTIERLSEVAGIERVYVLLAADDAHWERLCSDLPQNVSAIRCGGATRATTVRQGLAEIAGHVRADDWVLVHDAARPCVDPRCIEALMLALRDDPVGGLLALPVPDTIKRGNGDRVTETIARDDLWLAQTPQMFRYGLLRAALEKLPADAVTDEAQAMEAMGYAPRLVAGDASNLKITYATDLALAEAILQSRDMVKENQ